MAGSTYKIIELVGTSDVSWEEAARTAVETAGGQGTMSTIRGFDTKLNGAFRQ